MVQVRTKVSHQEIYTPWCHLAWGTLPTCLWVFRHVKSVPYGVMKLDANAIRRRDHIL